MKKFYQEPQPGDLIAVCYNNSCTPAVFKKSTSRSYQFYIIPSIDWVERMELLFDEGRGKRAMTYIGERQGLQTVIKLDPKSANDELRDLYKRATDCLQKYNVL